MCFWLGADYGSGCVISSCEVSCNWNSSLTGTRQRCSGAPPAFSIAADASDVVWRGPLFVTYLSSGRYHATSYHTLLHLRDVIPNIVCCDSSFAVKTRRKSLPYSSHRPTAMPCELRRDCEAGKLVAVRLTFRTNLSARARASTLPIQCLLRLGTTLRGLSFNLVAEIGTRHYDFGLPCSS